MFLYVENEVGNPLLDLADYQVYLSIFNDPLAELSSNRKSATLTSTAVTAKRYRVLVNISSPAGRTTGCNWPIADVETPFKIRQFPSERYAR